MRTEVDLAPAPGRDAGRSWIGDALPLHFVANFGGTLSVALAQLVLAPFYLRALGIEAVGLIGFVAMLQLVVLALDLGLSSVFNRELARDATRGDRASESPALLVSFERIYWASAAAVAALLASLAPWLSRRWLDTADLPPGDVVVALRLASISIALQLPLLLYQSGLLGLGRHIRLNLIRGGLSALSVPAIFLVISFVSRGTAAVFATQIVLFVVQILALRRELRSALGHGPAPAADASSPLRRLLPLAAGIAAVTASGALLGQIDKLAASQYLSLTDFGYYSLAVAAASVLYLGIAPVFQTIFPRLSSCAAARDDASLRESFFAGSEAMACAVFPLAAVLAWRSEAALRIWTADATAAAAAAPVFRLLAAAVALNAASHLPYALQMATGRTRSAAVMNTILLVSAILGARAMVPRFGASGAAAICVLIQVGSLFAVAPTTIARQLGVASLWRWYAVLLRSLVVATLAAALSQVPVEATTRGGNATILALAAVIAYGATAAASPPIRRQISAFVVRAFESVRGRVR